jgi:hypothetical protein
MNEPYLCQTFDISRRLLILHFKHQNTLGYDSNAGNFESWLHIRNQSFL